MGGHAAPRGRSHAGIAVLRDHETNRAVIIKDGKVHKNTLAVAGR
jgi:hypothetical protein